MLNNSAKVVYRILRRLVDTVESLVRGETRDVVAAQVQAASARYAEQEAQNRIKIATSLTKLQQQLNASGDPEAIRGELDRILNKLVPLMRMNKYPEPRPRKKIKGTHSPPGKMKQSDVHISQILAVSIF